MLSSFNDLCLRDVINVADGKYLGKIIDVVIDMDRGVISGIIFVNDGLFAQKVIVGYNVVKLIGVDVVLVDLSAENDENIISENEV